jgi:hypothetical protein
LAPTGGFVAEKLFQAIIFITGTLVFGGLWLACEVHFGRTPSGCQNTL